VLYEHGTTGVVRRCDFEKKGIELALHGVLSLWAGRLDGHGQKE